MANTVSNVKGVNVIVLGVALSPFIFHTRSLIQRKQKPTVSIIGIEYIKYEIKYDTMLPNARSGKFWQPFRDEH